MAAPTIYLIAGCNGAGKTTFAKQFLPHEVKCLRFYNADEIARGLSPLDPSAGALKAGRLLLGEVHGNVGGAFAPRSSPHKGGSHIRSTFSPLGQRSVQGLAIPITPQATRAPALPTGCDFRSSSFSALESTLSGKTYISTFQHALSLGYELELHYLWLSSVDQAIARVRRRVRMGGHNIPTADIRRRFKRSLVHLSDDYLPLATRWAIWDNRRLPTKRFAISTADDIDSARRLIAHED